MLLLALWWLWRCLLGVTQWTRCSGRPSLAFVLQTEKPWAGLSTDSKARGSGPGSDPCKIPDLEQAEEPRCFSVPSSEKWRRKCHLHLGVLWGLNGYGHMTHIPKTIALCYLSLLLFRTPSLTCLNSWAVLAERPVHVSGNNCVSSFSYKVLL